MTKHYILDTSVYGVLVDRNEADYEIVKKLIDYAKENRGDFITTLVIAKEIDAEDLKKEIKDVIKPEYYLSVSDTYSPIEISRAEEYPKTKKLAWNYIQKLEKKDADRVMNDALNYALASIAEADVFVTRNRRDILAESYHHVLRKSNKKMGCKFVEIKTPTEFYESLV